MKKHTLLTNNKSMLSLGVIAAVLMMPFALNHFTHAAGVSALSDTVTRHMVGEGSNHVISFTMDAATSIIENETIVLTFASGDAAGEFFDLAAMTLDDVAFTAGLTGTKPTGATVLTTGIAATATDWGISATNGAANTDMVITLTAPSTAATYGAAGATVTLTFGATNQITNPTVASDAAGGNNLGTTEATRYNVMVAGTFGDMGTFILPILDDDQIHVTAEVASEFVFELHDAADDNGSSLFTDHANIVDLGVLSSAAAKFATEGDGSGGGAAVTTGGAHGIKVGTNAASGFAISYSGATLTSGSNTITEIGAAAAASAPGTEQFGMCLSLDTTGVAGTDATDTTQDAVISDADYDCGGTGYAYTAAGETIVTHDTGAGSPGPTSLTFFDVQYIGNVSALTEAGKYTADIQFLATPTF